MQSLHSKIKCRFTIRNACVYLYLKLKYFEVECLTLLINNNENFI